MLLIITAETKKICTQSQWN